MRLIDEGDTSDAMQTAGAGAGSLAPGDTDSVDLLSTAALSVDPGARSGGLSMSAASVGAALAATGAPLLMAASAGGGGTGRQEPVSGSLPVDGGDSTEPHPYVAGPASGAHQLPQPSAAAGPSGGSGDAPAGSGAGQPGRAGRQRSGQTPPTEGFVPREMVARRRAAEAMTRAIVMAPPLPPSMLTGAQPVQYPGAQPTSGPITQPGTPPTPATGQPSVQQQAAPGARTPAKNRRRGKGRKQGAHTAGMPLVGTEAQQPPTGPMQAPGAMPAPGTASMPIGYNHQGYPPGYVQPGYPQGYPPQGYPQPGYPQGYPQPGYPPGYVQPGYPQGYPPQGYQQAAPTGAMPVSTMGSVGVPTAPPHQQMPVARTASPGPSGPARWAMLAAVLVVIVGIVVGVLVSQNGDPDSAADASPSSTPSASATEAVESVDLDFTTQSFASSGTGIEDKGDGEYSSQTYNSVTFGNYKDGVGLILDLGSAQKVTSVNFNVGGSPVTVGLRATDNLSTKDLSVYEKVVNQTQKTGEVSMDASAADAHRYWLIWVTVPAARSEGGYGVTLTDVSVTGPKS